ncbi:hypothetical protein LTR36_002807 [Oleoguttula mirabilis]|uniref:Uncharacterized protein n=1 Tax=Oleoguttula mirabilis TaxID=1507867 RepID=A0AAV9JJW5_9PEZI|nr:hypothetical protein LTR36_002807 [Oleoguttula mirabilis]
MAARSLLLLIGTYAALSAAWSLNDDWYLYYPGEASPTQVATPTSSAAQGSPSINTTDPEAPPLPYVRPDDLLNTLHNSDTCYTEADLSGLCGSLYTYEDDCARFGPGNHEFKICNGAEAFAMQCNVTEYHEYRYRVIGYRDFEEKGCVGKDCPPDFCKNPGKGNIIFSTASEPDALMVMTTSHRVHYHTQLRARLEREGFLTYPVPDAVLSQSWCNAETIMKVSKDGVSRANVGFLRYRCGKAVICSTPSQDTMRKVRDILDSDPSVEIGLSVGLPAFFVGLFILWITCICKWCCFSGRTRPQPRQDEEDAGPQDGEADDHVKPVARKNPRSQPDVGEYELPVYGSW